jgi:hypothetical protein
MIDNRKALMWNMNLTLYMFSILHLLSSTIERLVQYYIKHQLRRRNHMNIVTNAFKLILFQKTKLKHAPIRLDL